MTMPSPTAIPAPVLLRGVAWIVDSLVVVVPLEVLGWIWFEPSADLGDAGRLIGAAAVALYFGVFESGWGKGMSLGKAWLGLQVVDLSGAFVSPARAAARALFAEAPFLLGGVAVPHPYVAAGSVVWLLVGGLRLAQPYLLVFNRPSRRCLHDFGFGTIVIRRDSGIPTPSPLKLVHAAVVAALFALVPVGSGALSLLIPTLPRTADVVGGELSRRVAALPEVRSAKTIYRSGWSSGSGRSEGLHITAELRRWPADSATVANAAAQAIFRGDAPLTVGLPVTITLRRRFTFGVADFEYTETYRLPAQGPATEGED
jgi:uncharacterized RDD family membrane protein YckC